MKKSTIIGTIVIAIMYIIGMVAIVWFAFNSDNTPPTATATADVVYNATLSDAETEETEEVEESETRVLLVDKSGSLDGLATANAGYDTVIKFSEYLGQEAGNSYICTNIVRTLDMGVKELGIFSDLESYPESEQSSLEGKYYSNREVYFFLTEEVDESYVQRYEELFTKALDEDTCTLVFVYFNGTKVVIYDNYGSVEESEAVADDSTSTEEFSVHTEVVTEMGDYVSVNVLAIIVAVLYTIIMALIELLLLLCGRETVVAGPVPPTDIQQALKNPTALDGSSSVAHLYQKMVDWAKSEGVSEVYRFADGVQMMTLKKAEKTQAGGQTHGWSALAQMATDGCSKITIVSDFEFNDDKSACDGITFNEITCIVPAEGYSVQVIEGLKQMTSGDVKIIEI